MTLAQQRPVGGPSIPGQEKASITALGIDLGSRYASQLGFEGMTVYEADSPSPPLVLIEPSPPTSKKKKKKRRNKKKEKQDEKKELGVSDDEEEGDC